MKSSENKKNSDRTNPKLVIFLCTSFVALAMLTGFAVFTASVSGVSDSRHRAVSSIPAGNIQSNLQNILVAPRDQKEAGKTQVFGSGSEEKQTTENSSSQEDSYKKNYMYYIPKGAYKSGGIREDLTGSYVQKDNQYSHICFSRKDENSYRCVITRTEQGKETVVYEFVCSTNESYLTYTGGIKYNPVPNGEASGYKNPEAKEHSGKIYVNKSTLTWTDSDGSHGIFVLK